jgi:hypothetical protein
MAIDAKLDAATAGMKRCAVDSDCTVVAVPCGFAAVARASAAAAASAMGNACPPAGAAGGIGPVVPTVRCAAGRCVTAQTR